MMVPTEPLLPSVSRRSRRLPRWNTTASAGGRWPCRITNRELYHW